MDIDSTQPWHCQNFWGNESCRMAPLQRGSGFRASSLTTLAQSYICSCHTSTPCCSAHFLPGLDRRRLAGIAVGRVSPGRAQTRRP